jgi:hypothetical protein
VVVSEHAREADKLERLRQQAEAGLLTQRVAPLDPVSRRVTPIAFTASYSDVVRGRARFSLSGVGQCPHGEEVRALGRAAVPG